MSGPGRPKVPDKLKQLQGTFRKDRANDDVVEFSIVAEVPPPPDYFNKFAKIEWVSMTTELINSGILQATDMALLSAYCMEMGEYHACKQLIKRKGRIITTPKGFPMLRPEIKMMNDSLKNAMNLAAKFGFSPVDRQKLKFQKKETGGLDPIREMLNRKKK